MKLQTAATFIEKILQCKDDQFVDRRSLAREIGITIFEISTTKSGLVSKSLCDSVGYRSANYCEEHYHSRQKSGETIISMYESDQLDFNVLCRLLKEFSSVHLVTSQENNRLSPIQNGKDTKDLTWQEQYKLCGIELVEDRGVAPVWFWKEYIINDKCYGNIEYASEDLQLDWTTIRKRCNAKSKCWKDWKSR